MPRENRPDFASASWTPPALAVLLAILPDLVLGLEQAVGVALGLGLGPVGGEAGGRGLRATLGGLSGRSTLLPGQGLVDDERGVPPSDGGAGCFEPGGGPRDFSIWSPTSALRLLSFSMYSGTRGATSRPRSFSHWSLASFHIRSKSGETRRIGHVPPGTSRPRRTGARARAARGPRGVLGVLVATERACCRRGSGPRSIVPSARRFQERTSPLVRLAIVSRVAGVRLQLAVLVGIGDRDRRSRLTFPLMLSAPL